jgi:hypothetical protein
MRVRLAAGCLLLILAAFLRSMRVIARWDEVALAYAAYAEPAAAAWSRGDVGAALTRWVGLHPPLHGALIGLIEVHAPVPMLMLGLSAMASLCTVGVAIWRWGLVAGAVLAVSPLQLAYAAEVNNYPLAVLLFTLALGVARGPVWILALVTVAAGWTHLLAGLGALGVVVWRCRQPGTARASLLAGVALGLAPIALGAVVLLARESTHSQVLEVSPLLSVFDVAGWAVLILGGLALPGLRGPAGAGLLGVGLGLALALSTGAAAPHQYPYFLFFGPPIAMALGQARARHLASIDGWIIGAVLVWHLAWVGQTNWRLVGEITADMQRERGLDLAIAASAPGDTLWIVTPALQADDDKGAISTSLWRFPIWQPLPIARPVDFEYKDWRYGQPRAWRGRNLHTSTELEPGPFDHVAAVPLSLGHLVYVVVTEHAPATGLVARVERTLRPYGYTFKKGLGAGELGEDRVYIVSTKGQP